MNSRLELSVSPSLKLTPSLALNLKLLQLPALGLSEFIENELASNPLVEDYSFVFESSRNFTPEEEYEKEAVYLISVGESLKAQAAAEFDGSEREIAFFMVENLDERGFLTLTEGEIAEKFRVSLEVVRKVRSILKTFEPVGCGSYSLKELLEIQLKEMGAEEKFLRALNYLDCVNSPSTFKVKTGFSDGDYQSFLSLLKRCDPSPGKGIFQRVPVKPEGRVWLDGGNVKVEMYQHVKFNFTLNTRYLRYASSDELKKYLREKYQRVLWLKKSLEQRAETLKKVVRTVFEFQREFLKDGRTLKPLSLSDISKATSLHESTVSRALKDKFIETPYGLFPLRFFLSNSRTRYSERVKEAIREIVESEDKERPLSDSKIAEILKSMGFNVARRTVAKYRESLGIPSAFRRKKK